MSKILSTGPGWCVTNDTRDGRVVLELDVRDCRIEVKNSRCLIELPAWLVQQILSDSAGKIEPVSEVAISQHDQLGERSLDTPVIAHTVISIQRAVARFYVCGLDVIMGTSRRPGDTRTRHVAMFLARKWTQQSFPELGEAFGRDHSTVQYGVRKITESLTDDDLLGREIAILESALLSSLLGRSLTPCTETINGGCKGTGL
jgi:hypothetical protein